MKQSILSLLRAVNNDNHSYYHFSFALATVVDSISVGSLPIYPWPNRHGLSEPFFLKTCKPLDFILWRS